MQVSRQIFHFLQQTGYSYLPAQVLLQKALKHHDFQRAIDILSKWPSHDIEEWLKSTDHKHIENLRKFVNSEKSQPDQNFPRDWLTVVEQVQNWSTAGNNPKFDPAEPNTVRLGLLATKVHEALPPSELWDEVAYHERAALRTAWVEAAVAEVFNDHDRPPKCVVVDSYKPAPRTCAVEFGYGSDDSPIVTIYLRELETCRRHRIVDDLLAVVIEADEPVLALRGKWRSALYVQEAMASLFTDFLPPLPNDPKVIQAVLENLTWDANRMMEVYCDDHGPTGHVFLRLGHEEISRVPVLSGDKSSGIGTYALRTEAVAKERPVITYEQSKNLKITDAHIAKATGRVFVPTLKSFDEVDAAVCKSLVFEEHPGYQLTVRQDEQPAVNCITSVWKFAKLAYSGDPIISQLFKKFRSWYPTPDHVTESHLLFERWTLFLKKIIDTAQTQGKDYMSSDEEWDTYTR